MTMPITEQVDQRPTFRQLGARGALGALIVCSLLAARQARAQTWGQIGASGFSELLVNGLDTCIDRWGVPTIAFMQTACELQPMAAGIVGTAGSSAMLGGAMRTYSTLSTSSPQSASSLSGQSRSVAIMQDALLISDGPTPASIAFTLQESGLLSAAVARTDPLPYGRAFFESQFLAPKRACTEGVRTNLVSLQLDPPPLPLLDFSRTVTCELLPGESRLDFFYINVNRIEFDIYFQPLTATVTQDFTHTSRLTGVQLLDAAGNDVTAQYDLAFASGAALETPTPTPEPSTAALLAGGLLALGAAARAGRARRS